MSYIEKKYSAKIDDIFENLSKLDSDLLKLLSQKSIKPIDDIAKLCAVCNKEINQILKKYYPEIKDLDTKLKIKSTLNFYYDLIDQLTDFVKNVETFQKLDERYYDNLINFIREKKLLISGKYRKISAQELTIFYDKKTRETLEKILIEKIENKYHEFFTIGPFEQELKKIGQIAGAKSIYIRSPHKRNGDILESVESIIEYADGIDEAMVKKVGEELKKYLESKKYKVVIQSGVIFTNAKLLPDKS